METRLMALLSIYADAPRPLAFAQGRGVVTYTRTEHLAQPMVSLLDLRHAIRGAGLGVIRDRVMIKLTPSSPESPFRNGRVWLLRVADGYKAWEGWSDAQGWYTARGLEVGVVYVAVGIDPYREHKTTGAGPVIAVHTDTLT
ncbi:hypothetical protein G7047_19215 [Diaphorobacter sp. HDW4A]|uniref:hypothetical protein n=1 Tax=Diaphorobacter sp. HDW4A TaxID=2714924 RepID=UPI001407E531|nr:hypothetical protein [Diaphorobacter sp. HDW4A]QIL81808.1 hypothetical protein G7047_19215 [Diaphorobacter sp. HDW4A]